MAMIYKRITLERAAKFHDTWRQRVRDLSKPGGAPGTKYAGFDRSIEASWLC
jgi:hypothetical protein